MNSRRLLYHLSILWAILVACSGKVSCPCQDEKLCTPLIKREVNKHEVYAFNNGATDISHWGWDTITAVVAPLSFKASNKSQASTMCLTHQKGKKFGITVEMDLRGKLNSSSFEAKNWSDDVITAQAGWSADIINIDLLPYFKSDHGSDEVDHIELVLIIKSLHEKLDRMHRTTGHTIELTCVLPWIPPCTSTDATCPFPSLIIDACDYFIISPDSFLDTDDKNCRASATMPFSKLVYGISEYNAHSLSSKRIILGVSWHGYDYTCTKLTNDICTVETVEVDGVLQCDFSHRKRMTYTDLLLSHYNKMSEHGQNELFNAPYFDYKNVSVNHQVWFEDHHSLVSKYSMVKELSLAGLGIIYADDLSPSKKLIAGDSMLWSWVAHEFLLAKSQSHTQHDLHCADTVAGVAVGCLLFGCVMGVAFTCISLHKRIRKPKQPFRRDTNMTADEYTDEDPDL